MKLHNDLLASLFSPDVASLREASRNAVPSTKSEVAPPEAASVAQDESEFETTNLWPFHPFVLTFEWPLPDEDGGGSGDGGGGGDGEGISSNIGVTGPSRPSPGRAPSVTVNMPALTQTAPVSKSTAHVLKEDAHQDAGGADIQIAPAGNREYIDKVRLEVAEQTRYLRSRLRTIIKTQQQRRWTHGVPRGTRMSSRFLVDTVIALRSHEEPKRAFKTVSTIIEPSFASAILIDQSGSMNGVPMMVALRATIAMVEPLDYLHFPTMVAGYGTAFTLGGRQGNGVLLDIYKMWDERFTSVRGRFSTVHAAGGNPDQDAIIYATKAILRRPEQKKVIFVITDGAPDSISAVQAAIAWSKHHGIRVIGIGLGATSLGVMPLYEDHIYSPTLEGLPVKLVAKLTEIVRAGS